MRKKRKGFTLVELLVVIAIIALLMGILMPALARVRAIAFRVVCGTNLAGLGKAMLIYANDYEDELPQAGYPGSIYATAQSLGPNAWKGPTRLQAFGTPSGSKVTVSSSLYLLIKYSEVGAKQFVCRGTDTTEFKIPPGTTRPGTTDPLELIDCFDFGANPILHCSYSYHSAYDSPFALNVASSQPGMAVAADRNPWLDPASLVGDLLDFLPDIDPPWKGTAEEAKLGNALAHGGEGQNVLFLDSHVAYEKRSFCGVMDDNIYTRWTDPGGGDRQLGSRPMDGGAVPRHKEDSLLLNEGKPGAGGGTNGGTTNGGTTNGGAPK